MKPLVSVIVTCFNHENYIKECLESIFAQTYSNIELFVLNDGSTDKSGKIIEEIVQSSPYPQTTYIVQENMGLVLTRNKALNLINGDYFLFVDSDNYLEPNYLEEMLSVAQNEGANIVYPPIRNAETKDLILDAREFDLGKLYIENYIESCSLVERQKIKDLTYDPFLNYKKLEDYDFFLNLIVTRGLIAKPCHTTHLNYRVLPNSLNDHGNIRYHYEVYSYILGKYFAFYPKLAQRAMQEHFNRLNIENSIENEEIAIDIKEGEHWTPIFKNRVLRRDYFSVPFDAGYHHIRVRPSNIPSFYKSFVLFSKKYGRAFIPENTNGINYGNFFVFPEFYPEIEYKLKIEDGDSLCVQYSRYNINDIVADDYIGKEFAQAIVEQTQQLQASELREMTIREQLEQAQQQLTEVQQSYQILASQHQSVLSSRRWRWTSKFLAFFRRNQ